MPAPTPVSAAPAKAATKTVELHDMKAVYGLLIHPYTLTHFRTEKASPHELDSWCQVQIDGGKLELA